MRETYSNLFIIVKRGVPQGTVLDPFLFILLISDLPDQILNPVKFFADDVNIY